MLGNVKAYISVFTTFNLIKKANTGKKTIYFTNTATCFY